MVGVRKHRRILNSEDSPLIFVSPIKEAMDGRSTVGLLRDESASGSCCVFLKEGFDFTAGEMVDTMHKGKGWKRARISWIKNIDPYLIKAGFNFEIEDSADQ